ncbi:MAG: hypothetical protein OEO77_02205 [Acidimicrobiia bacterium]|nr:hypothetical protein [Acidimicrobiia bacterium]
MKLTVPELVEQGTPDALLERINAFCTDENWEGIVDLRDRCTDAVERGKQLWAVAHHADYRLALEAPASWAAPVIDSPAGRFTLGPLTEVAAERHTWAELEPYLGNGPSRSVLAYERAIRGDDDVTGEAILEIPITPCPWEATYTTPLFKPSRAETDPPVPAELDLITLPSAGEVIDDLDTTDALVALASTWTDQSNGTVEAVAVEGSAFSAIAALGLRQARVASISGPDALAIMAWTAADGGAHGRRAGGAAGRFAAWWAAAALTDHLDDWPPSCDDLETAVSALRWWWWSDLFPATGWSCRLAVEDPAEGYAWVLNAADAD